MQPSAGEDHFDFPVGVGPADLKGWGDGQRVPSIGWDDERTVQAVAAVDPTDADRLEAPVKEVASPDNPDLTRPGPTAMLEAMLASSSKDQRQTAATGGSTPVIIIFRGVTDDRNR